MKTLLSLRSVLGIGAPAAILLLIVMPLYGQWVKVPTGSIPRGPDGKPNLSVPAPKAADGHPDLSGIWESGGAKYIQNIAADLKPGDVPFQPWAKALVDQRAERIAFGKGSVCELPAPRRSKSQCVPATVEGDPKIGRHRHPL